MIAKKLRIRSVISSLILVLLADTMSRAQCTVWGCGSRGTITHWGEGFTGGPDLSEPLVTDRPDFTEASSTVGLGVSQFEFGYTYTFDNDGTDQVIRHSYPEVLLRQGFLANWLELRVAANFSHERTNGAGLSGADDLYLGFKVGLTPQQGWLPEMGLIPQTTVPSGNDDFTADRLLAGANWLYSWDLSENFVAGGSTQFNRALDSLDNEFTEWAQSFTVGVSLTDVLSAYAEWFALFPPSDAAGGEDQHYFNGGFAVLFSNDVQWDIRAGVGLNDFSDDYFVGSGLSIRFR